jgi:molecular chaperone DnaJ
VTVRREWFEKDYYDVLGVDKTASAKDIKRAYRKLAQEHHPDTTAGDPTSETRFKEINEAYSVLSDETTRAEYDQARASGSPGGFPGGFPGAGGGQYVTVEDLGDLFGGGGVFGGGLGDLFGRGARQAQPRAGRDIEAEVSLSFHEAIQGTTRSLSVDGGPPIQVKIPAGVNDNAKIRVRGKGGPGVAGGPAGDLYVRVHAGSHPVFGRSGKDLKIEVPITFTEAALGADITVPTLDGHVTLRVPPGTPAGKRFKVSGKGVASSNGTGDLIVTVSVTVPTELDDDQRTLLEQLKAREEGANPRSHLGA